MLELARADKHIYIVTSDSRGSGKLTAFGQELPEQTVEVGIAEQNLVGIAAGLASTGKKVFAVSPASFLTTRALEQIKNDVAYSDNPVTLVGISAGVSYGALGSTHHSLHDLAVLRAISNIDIVVPSDNFETRRAVAAAADYPKPVYLRFGKKPMPDLYSPDAQFEIGKSLEVRPGRDATFIATGEAVWRAVRAAENLAAEGLNCRVVSMHTIKPLDTEAVLRAAGETRCVVCVEEHSVHGGLGEACAAVIAQSDTRVPMRIVGLPDEHTVTGSQDEILAHYGIDPSGLARTMRQMPGVSGESTS
ncbi:MAG: transketolase family protein [Phycisphaerae bacterium]|nr:transketolase family protein [Phycisphaerae bacterium]